MMEAARVFAMIANYGHWCGRNCYGVGGRSGTCGRGGERFEAILVATVFIFVVVVLVDKRGQRTTYDTYDSPLSFRQLRQYL